MGVRTMPLLSDILWMRPTQKEPRGCHQTLTCLLSSSASSPCRGHPQSCQSQSPTHEVAHRACRTIWKPYFPFSNHNHWNFREKACGGWRVGVGNSSLQTSRSIGSPSLSAGYDTVEIQSHKGDAATGYIPICLSFHALADIGSKGFCFFYLLLSYFIMEPWACVSMYSCLYVCRHTCAQGDTCVYEVNLRCHASGVIHIAFRGQGLSTRLD